MPKKVNETVFAYVVSQEDSTPKNKIPNFSYQCHQETLDKNYPLCFVVADGLLC